MMVSAETQVKVAVPTKTSCFGKKKDKGMSVFGMRSKTATPFYSLLADSHGYIFTITNNAEQIRIT